MAIGFDYSSSPFKPDTPDTPDSQSSSTFNPSPEIPVILRPEDKQHPGDYTLNEIYEICKNSECDKCPFNISSTNECKIHSFTGEKSEYPSDWDWGAFGFTAKEVEMAKTLLSLFTISEDDSFAIVRKPDGLVFVYRFRDGEGLPERIAVDYGVVAVLPYCSFPTARVGMQYNLKDIINYWEG